MKEKVFCDVNGMFKRSLREITASGGIFTQSGAFSNFCIQSPRNALELKRSINL